MDREGQAICEALLIMLSLSTLQRYPWYLKCCIEVILWSDSSGIHRTVFKPFSPILALISDPRWGRMLRSRRTARGVHGQKCVRETCWRWSMIVNAYSIASTEFRLRYAQ